MSNEIKIALLAIVAIALSFWGIKFIKGKNLFSRSNIYYVEYPNALSIKTSSEVVIQGVSVGFVSAVNLDLETRKVKVTLDLRKDLQLPKGTKAEIFANGFMGTKSVRLVLPPMDANTGILEPGSYLTSGSVGFLGANIPREELEDYMSVIQLGVKGILDTISNSLSGNGDPNSPMATSLRDLQGTLSNLESSTAQLDQLLAASSGNINGSLKNMNTITGNLASSNSKINSIIDNADKFSGQLNAVDLKQTMTEVNQTIANLKATLARADQSLNSVNGLMSDIGEGKGSLGKLLKSDSLYTRIDALGARSDSLVKDLKARPYRYIPLKGRKRVMRYDRKDAAEKK